MLKYSVRYGCMLLCGWSPPAGGRTSGAIVALAGPETYANPFPDRAIERAGDGESTFGLPDLRGRVPIHQGNGFILAETGGAEEITLTVTQIATHTHPFQASTNPGTASNVQNNDICSSPSILLYVEGQSPDTNLNPSVVGQAGGSQPHTNFQPYLCVDFIISLFGIFPSPT